jgi:hypothetical protein
MSFAERFYAGIPMLVRTPKAELNNNLEPEI